jgi:hypothetical protein
MSDENPYGGEGKPPEEQQPPSPYQGSAPQPPGNYPAGGYSAPQRSDRWKVWLGIALAIPVLAVTTVLAGAVGQVDNLGSLAGLIGLTGLLGPIVLLFLPATRKLALGLIIGYAALVILAAGACVALIATWDGGG